MEEGVGRTELRLLYGELNPATRADRIADLLWLMTNNHDHRLGTKGISSAEHVFDEGKSCRAMEHLGHARFKASALTSRQNDDVERH